MISRLIDNENSPSEVVELSHSHLSLANELLQLVFKCPVKDIFMSDHQKENDTHLFIPPVQIFPAACRRQTLNPPAQNPNSVTCSHLVVPGLLVTLFVTCKPC